MCGCLLRVRALLSHLATPRALFFVKHQQVAQPHWGSKRKKGKEREEDGEEVGPGEGWGECKQSLEGRSAVY